MTTDTEIDADALDRSATLEDLETDAADDLEHVIVENEDAPNECAIFPGNASEDELMTNWITAHDDAFVDLEAMR